MNLEKGSSKLLIAAMVVFDTAQAAHDMDHAVNNVRTTFGWKSHQELHFNKMSRSLRIRSLQAIAPLNFAYYAMVMDKAKLYHEGFRTPASLYKCTCNYLFSNSRDHLRDAKVVVDGSGSREFKRQFQSYLRRRANEHSQTGIRLIRKIKLEDSNKNNLIQVADMVCGAVARSFTDKPDARIYR